MGDLSPSECLVHADIDRFVTDQLDDTRLEVVATCSWATRSALEAARQGELDAAADLLGTSARLSSAAGLGDGPTLALDSMRLAAVAYLRYRQERFADAEETISAAMAADARLIVDHGVVTMGAHLVQLGHNLIRVAIRSGDEPRATALADDMLSYLADVDQPWPWPVEPAVGGSAVLGSRCRTLLALQIRHETERKLHTGS